MKTTITILTLVFTLSANLIFAGNEGVSLNSGSSMSTTANITLAPVTPLEATFEDDATVADFSTLAPATPAEATFSDEADNTGTDDAIAPVAPLTADFEEIM